MSFFDIFRKKNPALQAELQRLKKNAITMETVIPEGVLPPDACKIGGKPFLPADFVWPEFTGKEDGVSRPLSFFCQLNLSVLAPMDSEKLLPAKGILSFFYECESFCWGFDPEDKGAARVFYFADTTGFIPFDVPQTLDEAYVIPELAISFRSGSSYPRFEEFEIHSGMECDWEEYDRVLAKLGVDTEEESEEHKILGYADIIQNEMLTECERTTRGLYCGDPESYRNTPEAETADIQEKAKDWTLLLQLSTIQKGDFEWMFGDCGMLYYYIRKEDLANKCFENTWFSLQCG